jgi:hypothetical protein
MKEPVLDFKGWRGRAVRSTLTRASEPRAHLAVMFPGYAYTSAMPVLYYTRQMLLARGADVITVDFDWSEAEAFVLADDEEQLRWMNHEVAAALDAAGRLAGYERTTLIAKSLSCLPLALTLREGQSFGNADVVWLTPPCQFDAFQGLLPKVSNRAILVTGTADSHYSAAEVDAAARAGVETVVMEGLDHSLEQVDQPIENLRSMGEVMRRLDVWVDQPSD